MSYIQHHAIIVTSDSDKRVSEAYASAIRIFRNMVSGPTDGIINGYRTITIVPDGSKEGWDESEECDRQREEFKRWLQSNSYEDGSNPYGWVEVQFGGGFRSLCISAGSDVDQFNRLRDDRKSPEVQAEAKSEPIELKGEFPCHLL